MKTRKEDEKKFGLPGRVPRPRELRWGVLERDRRYVDGKNCAVRLDEMKAGLRTQWVELRTGIMGKEVAERRQRLSGSL